MVTILRLSKLVYLFDSPGSLTEGQGNDDARNQLLFRPIRFQCLSLFLKNADLQVFRLLVVGSYHTKTKHSVTYTDGILKRPKDLVMQAKSIQQQ